MEVSLGFASQVVDGLCIGEISPGLFGLCREVAIVDVPKVVDGVRALFAPMEAEPMMGASPDEETRTLWVDKVHGLPHKTCK